MPTIVANIHYLYITALVKTFAHISICFASHLTILSILSPRTLSHRQHANTKLPNKY